MINPVYSDLDTFDLFDLVENKIRDLNFRDDHKRVFMLWAFSGSSYRRIGSHCGVSGEHVRRIIQRILISFRNDSNLMHSLDGLFDCHLPPHFPSVCKYNYNWSVVAHRETKRYGQQVKTANVFKDKSQALDYLKFIKSPKYVGRYSGKGWAFGVYYKFKDIKTSIAEL